MAEETNQPSNKEGIKWLLGKVLKYLNAGAAIFGWLMLLIIIIDKAKHLFSSPPLKENFRQTANLPDSIFTDDSIYVVSRKLDTVIKNNDEEYWQERQAEVDDRR